MSDREKAKKSIVEQIKKIKNDDVLRSVVLVIGDYYVGENGAERASYITPILYQIVSECDLHKLQMIYSFAKGICE